MRDDDGAGDIAPWVARQPPLVHVQPREKAPHPRFDRAGADEAGGLVDVRAQIGDDGGV